MKILLSQNHSEALTELFELLHLVPSRLVASVADHLKRSGADGDPVVLSAQQQGAAKQEQQPNHVSMVTTAGRRACPLGLSTWIYPRGGVVMMTALAGFFDNPRYECGSEGSKYTLSPALSTCSSSS